MAKLIFRYGAMGSSKTAQALMVRYNYQERGKKVLLIKPDCENRDGEHIIRSRIGLEAECMPFSEFSNLENPDYDAVIVDECQFLTEEQVDFLSDVVDFRQIPVICYGLRTDFMGKLFEGAKRLMELADTIEQIPTVCWCGKKAQFNGRVKNHQIVKTGKQVELGGNESYVSLCRLHYKLNMLEEDK